MNVCEALYYNVKIFGKFFSFRITYIVLVQTLNHAQSINQSVSVILFS